MRSRNVSNLLKANSSEIIILDQNFVKKNPNAVSIKAIPFSEKVKLIWKANTELENKAPIENYVIIVEKEADKGRSKRISIHNNPTCKNIYCYLCNEIRIELLNI